MQNNDTPLSFLRNRIREIKVALFKSEINSELSLPNNIIQTISVDDEGFIYFFTSCNNSYAAQINQPFYAYLDYHKKGTDIRLCISGSAQIISEEKDEDVSESVLPGFPGSCVVLVKMKMMQAEYSGHPEERVSLAQRIKHSFTHLFTQAPSGHHYTFG